MQRSTRVVVFAAQSLALPACTGSDALGPSSGPETTGGSTGALWGPSTAGTAMATTGTTGGGGPNHPTGATSTATATGTTTAPGTTGAPADVGDGGGPSTTGMTDASTADVEADAAGPSDGSLLDAGDSAIEETCDLPRVFQWESSGILVGPKPDASHDIVSVKDPSIVFHDGQWLIYATTANTAGQWSLAHLAFDAFASASEANPYFMDRTPGFAGYHAAPQVFYFEPSQTWYLIQQAQPPQYSTTDDPSDPTSWSEPQFFYPGGNHLPAGAPALPIDYWVICDEQSCFLFFTGDDGNLYRTKTALTDFPHGFGEISVVLRDSKFALFEGSAHYKVEGQQLYLTIIEAIGGGGRYYRAWTSTSLESDFRPLADAEQQPFAGAANVRYAPGVQDWTNDVSHGELLRKGVDQTMTIDPCNLRLLYQGVDPTRTNVDYSQLPYRLGLLTHKPTPQ